MAAESDISTYIEDDGVVRNPVGARRLLAEWKQKFIAHVKSLVADMIETFPGDPVVNRVQNQVTACAEIKPEKIIQNIGEVLYSFHTQIIDKDEAFFLKQTFDEIARDATNKKHAVDGIHIANRVKAMYGELPPEARDAYLNLLVSMLDLFLFISVLSQKMAEHGV